MFCLPCSRCWCCPPCPRCWSCCSPPCPPAPGCPSSAPPLPPRPSRHWPWTPPRRTPATRCLDHNPRCHPQFWTREWGLWLGFLPVCYPTALAPSCHFLCSRIWPSILLPPSSEPPGGFCSAPLERSAAGPAFQQQQSWTWDWESGSRGEGGGGQRSATTSCDHSWQPTRGEREGYYCPPASSSEARDITVRRSKTPEAGWLGIAETGEHWTGGWLGIAETGATLRHRRHRQGRGNLAAPATNSLCVCENLFSIWNEAIFLSFWDRFTPKTLLLFHAKYCWC